MTAARNRCQRAVFNLGSASDPVGTLSKGRTGVPSERNERAGLVFFGLAFHGRLRSRLGMFGIVSVQIHFGPIALAPFVPLEAVQRRRVRCR